MNKHAVFAVLIGFLLAGCTTIGPQSVTRDRFDYNKAISDSWKEQTLLNIVKLRYADMPLFVEVASIVSGYTLESSVNLGANFSTAALRPSSAPPTRPRSAVRASTRTGRRSPIRRSPAVTSTRPS